MIRRLFLPEEGEQWAAIDFSQQEPRILTHYAHAFSEYKNMDLPGVKEFVEAYNENPNMDFHSMVADMAEIPRKQAKVINLAMMYGMGVNKLSQQLDITSAGGQGAYQTVPRPRAVRSRVDARGTALPGR